MMGKGHFTKFTLLHAVIIHIPARFLGHTASMLQYLVFIMKLHVYSMEDSRIGLSKWIVGTRHI